MGRKADGLLSASLSEDGFPGCIIWEDGVVELPNGRLITEPYGTGQVTLPGIHTPRSVNLAKLVASYFVPNPEGWEYVKHVDGDKTNCRADNLEWVPQRPRRTRSELHKLNPEIIVLHVRKVPPKRIALKLGCSLSYVRQVIRLFEIDVAAVQLAEGNLPGSN